MVLTQHIAGEGGKYVEDSGFHTTMVLTQLDGNIYSLKNNKRFPYHYGSYATLCYRRTFGGFSYVSIPLWFLRNKKIHLT